MVLIIFPAEVFFHVENVSIFKQPLIGKKLGELLIIVFLLIARKPGKVQSIGQTRLQSVTTN